MGNVGRPAYIPSEEHFQCAYNGAKKGLNEEQIAKAIGIPYPTFRDHKHQFTSYIKKGRDEADDLNIVDVENSMLKSIKGFEYEEVHTTEKYVKIVEEDGTEIKGGVEVTVKTIKKLVPTSPVLAMFWAVNRSDRWHSINIRDDKGSMPPDKLEDALKAMSEIMDITHGGGERPGNGDK